MKGFILTRQRRDTANACELELWLSSDKGPIKLIVPDQYPVLFFRESDVGDVDSIINQFAGANYKAVI